MKKIAIVLVIISIIISSCINISDKSVSEKLSTSELSKSIKIDTSFANFYEEIRKKVDEFDDIKKAKFNDVTYRRLFKFVKFTQDSTYWNPLYETWEKEWENDFGIYSTQADSIIDYWRKFLEENSLNQYVNIELATIDKNYYSYIGELKDVNLGFRLTPLQGAIEQIQFNYGYKAKIDGDNSFEKHYCISTSPFSSPTVRYWEVRYSDKDIFAGKTVETFLRDYDLEIEITKLRKDGENMSTDDFNTPEEVLGYFNYEGDIKLMENHYKDKLIKKYIYKDYLRQWQYTNKKSDEVQEKEDKLCFDFLKEL